MTIASLAFACIFGGALFGFFLRSVLPQHHVNEESRKAVKTGAGLVATMAALVLGLLVSSSKSTFDEMNNGIVNLGAKTILLDRVLASYGPETRDVRNMIRNTVDNAIQYIWPEEHATQRIDAIAKSTSVEKIHASINNLEPQTDAQRRIQSEALQLSSDLALLRWTLLEQRHKSISAILLVVLCLWLAMLFTNFGMFAPRNPTVIAALGVAALSVSCALFIIIEMNDPLEGIIRVSSVPLHSAMGFLGK
jgi:Protein of unknown function (DUF4239)